MMLYFTRLSTSPRFYSSLIDFSGISYCSVSQVILVPGVVSRFLLLLLRLFARHSRVIAPFAGLFVQDSSLAPCWHFCFVVVFCLSHLPLVSSLFLTSR